jgi:type III pantothenate kinase
MATNWLALCIGNSRYHWGWFDGDRLVERCDHPHLEETIYGDAGTRGRGEGKIKKRGDEKKGRQKEENYLFDTNLELNLVAEIPWQQLSDSTPIYLASVVPEQTVLWEDYPNLHQISLEQIPIAGIYATMGIDRALAVFGASQVYGTPVLVIDAGTALTFTGVNNELELVGGAILPGLNLQFRSLFKHTAALPQVTIPTTLPSRWAKDTAGAIQSGIMYTILAGIKDFIDAWQVEFEIGKVVITGGDRSIIHQFLCSQNLLIETNLLTDSQLIFWGFQNLINTFKI